MNIFGNACSGNIRVVCWEVPVLWSTTCLSSSVLFHCIMVQISWQQLLLRGKNGKSHSHYLPERLVPGCW